MANLSEPIFDGPILNSKCLDSLTLLNLDAEGAVLLQEMLDAIQLAIQKCQQLEERIMKCSSNANLSQNESISEVKRGEGSIREMRTQLDNDLVSGGGSVEHQDDLGSRPSGGESVGGTAIPTPHVPSHPPGEETRGEAVQEEPLMPKPIVIKKEFALISDNHNEMNNTEVHENKKVDKMGFSSPLKEKSAEEFIAFNLPHCSRVEETEYQNYRSTEQKQIFMILPHCAMKEDVQAMFEKQKIYTTSIIIKWREDHSFAFVSFADEDAFQKCLDMRDSLSLYGEPVSVKPCEPRRQPRSEQTLGWRYFDSPHQPQKQQFSSRPSGERSMSDSHESQQDWRENLYLNFKNKVRDMSSEERSQERSQSRRSRSVDTSMKDFEEYDTLQPESQTDFHYDDVVVITDDFRDEYKNSVHNKRPLRGKNSSRARQASIRRGNNKNNSKIHYSQLQRSKCRYGNTRGTIKRGSTRKNQPQQRKANFPRN